MINCSQLPVEHLASPSKREAKFNIPCGLAVESDMNVQKAKQDDELQEEQPPFDEKIAEFAAGIGHELNNPLASIGGRVQLLMQTVTDENLKRDLAQIYSEIKRASDLISDIRLYACPPKPVLEAVDLSDVLQRVIDSFSSQASSDNIRFMYALPPVPSTILADASQIDVLFRAVIRNSMEVLENKNDTDKRLSISLVRGSETIDVVIADNGSGLTEYQQRHAFDPYYSARQANRGLGFGLCKAERIARMNKATIQIESVANTGTSVRIRFYKA